MAERTLSRPWTEEEDALLRAGVEQYGEQDQWKNIALLIPGRTNKACRKRWLHSLSPVIKKCAWSVEEDQLLLQLYAEYGPKWSAIARNIDGRTDDACSKRYRDALDPSLNKAPWTPEEDEKVMEAYARMGGKWVKVGQELGRGSLDCRNRWRLLERKRTARANQEASPIYNLQGHFEEGDSTMTVAPEVDLSSQTLWPYYPPEMYASLQDEESQGFKGFREPTPPLVQVSPYFAPFQYSSSSLSAALSCPPPKTKPLPAVSEVSTPSQEHFQSYSQPQSQATSPLFFDGFINPHDDVSMSQDDNTVATISDNSQSFFPPDITYSGQIFASLSLPQFQEPSSYSAVSPISPSVVSLPAVEAFQFNDSWNSPHLFSPTFLHDASPSLVQTSASTASETLDELSSTSTTPFPASACISPVASPNGGLSVELSIPMDGSVPQAPPAGGSLLFSVPSPNAPPLKRRKTAKRNGENTRLSGKLRLSTDPMLLPYACGHDTCWLKGAESSRSRYSTSKELFDHVRDVHGSHSNCEKPFRCALQGCGKSWKTLNGLQYHLQISSAHFKNALQSRFSAQAISLLEDQQQHSPTGGLVSDPSDTRLYACPKPGCFKAYRQQSGLRYHLMHGHPLEMPVQLPEVPPGLERELPRKAKKMRRKMSPEPPQTIATTS